MLAILAIAVGSVTATDVSPCARLLMEVATADYKRIAGAALDASADCTAVLALRLADRGETRYAAAYALALLSSPQSQDALYASLARHQDIRLKSLAAMGAGSVRRPKDVSFLCSALRGAPYGDEWPPIEAAALSLMLHDASECREALEAAAKPASISGHAARAALAAAKTKRTCRAVAASGNDTEAAVLAVMNCTLPRSEEAPAFYEAARNRVWRRAATGWTISEPATTEVDSLPAIQFRTVLGERGERALVSVGLTFGPLNGKGYDYLLAREGGDWAVIAIDSTWIS